jgi:hypothetical protein
VRWTLLAGTLVVSGCDLVFPPGAGPGGGEGVDAPIPRLPDADLSGLCVGLTTVLREVNALADAEIRAHAPDLNGGQDPVIGIDEVNQTLGLFKFDINNLPDGTPAWMAVTLRFAQDSCGGRCAPCLPSELPGTLSAYPLVSDWQEDEVTWTQTGTGGRLWDGATAGNRGPVGITVLHADGGDAAFTFDASLAPSAWAAYADIALRRMSFVVEAGAGAVMNASAKEGETACAHVPRAVLDLVYCQ